MATKERREEMLARFGPNGPHVFTPEEHAEGGKKSNEVKREYKTFKERLLKLMQETNPQTGNTFAEDLDAAALMKALTGNTKALEFVRNTIGEAPTQKVDINSNNISIKITDDQEVNVIENKEEE